MGIAYRQKSLWVVFTLFYLLISVFIIISFRNEPTGRKTGKGHGNMEENKETVTQTNEGQATTNQTTERTFTQDEVNRIVQERLARVKGASELDQRELDLQSREMALYAKEKIEENGLDKTLADELKGMDKATIDKVIKIITPMAQRMNEPIRNAVGHTNGKAIDSDSSIRAAMGLKR